MTKWRIDSGGNDLKISTPVEIFNSGEYPGSPSGKLSTGNEVYVNFPNGSTDNGFISVAKNAALTLTLVGAGQVNLELNKGERLIDSASKVKHTEWIVV